MCVFREIPQQGCSFFCPDLVIELEEMEFLFIWTLEKILKHKALNATLVSNKLRWGFPRVLRISGIYSMKRVVGEEWSSSLFLFFKNILEILFFINFFYFMC